jgi:hypothetical protein
VVSLDGKRRPTKVDRKPKAPTKPELKPEAPQAEPTPAVVDAEVVADAEAESYAPPQRFSQYHTYTRGRGRKGESYVDIGAYIDRVEDIAAFVWTGGCGGDLDRDTPLVAADLPEVLDPLSQECDWYDDAKLAGELADRLAAVLPRLHELQLLLSHRASGEGERQT